MTDVLATTEKPVSIYQEMKATSNFGGLTPKDGAVALTPTFLIDVYTFAAGTEGGLFSPSVALYSFEKRDPLSLIGVELKLADQASWLVELESAAGKSVIIYSGTNETQFSRGRDGSLYTLLWGDKLKVTTVGATLAMSCTIKLAPYYLAH